MADPRDTIPDVRDGLTRVQRLVLHELDRARRELGRESVPTALLYGRVVERVDLSEQEFVAVLQSLGAGGDTGRRETDRETGDRYPFPHTRWTGGPSRHGKG